MDVQLLLFFLKRPQKVVMLCKNINKSISKPVLSLITSMNI